jgi:hypothetical protein
MKSLVATNALIVAVVVCFTWMHLHQRRELASIRTELSEYRAFQQALITAFQASFKPELKIPSLAARTDPLDVIFDVVGEKIRHEGKLMTLDELSSAMPSSTVKGIKRAGIRTMPDADYETSGPVIEGLMKLLSINGVSDITFMTEENEN